MSSSSSFATSSVFGYSSLFLILFFRMNFVHAATLFFGATSDFVQPAPLALKAQKAQLNTLIDTFENNNAAERRSLSESDLVSVFRFCSILPVLEASGKLTKSEQSREICERLLALLRPLLAPRKRRHLTPEGNKLKKNLSAPKTSLERSGFFPSEALISTESD